MRFCSYLLRNFIVEHPLFGTLRAMLYEQGTIQDTTRSVECVLLFGVRLSGNLFQIIIFDAENIRQVVVVSAPDKFRKQDILFSMTAECAFAD